ncbi:argininosuccinate lyase [Alloyangia pacifica]|uniref:Argininosuccinate lyase n=1 Tax=Alloyangia pacifica TaxID=311180 RepID=A0A2U8H906_9RHOB|nr:MULTISPECIES: argininosuccinate lyase [Roseobacteraceae]AWI82382.1 argininosuccinate lyase [Alloyangia pacifica]
MITRSVLALGLVALLAACGADGPPTRPEPKERPAASGVSVHGTVKMGVAYP